jgi:hypothetical protein
MATPPAVVSTFLRLTAMGCAIRDKTTGAADQIKAGRPVGPLLAANKAAGWPEVTQGMTQLQKTVSVPLTAKGAGGCVK